MNEYEEIVRQIEKECEWLDRMHAMCMHSGERCTFKQPENCEVYRLTRIKRGYEPTKSTEGRG